MLTDGTGPNVAFGITFNLNGTPIPVTVDDVKGAKENGLDLALPGPVELGSFKDFQGWFFKEFGVKIPEASELPSPLDKIIGKLTTLVVTVQEAKVHIPGTKDTKRPNTEYKVLLSAEWPPSEGGIVVIQDLLTIEGGMFGISAEAKPA